MFRKKFIILTKYSRSKQVKHDFDGFSVVVYPDKDNVYVAHLGELPNISAFGDSFDKAVDELSIAWTLTKESYAAHNVPLPKPSKKVREDLDYRFIPALA